MIANILEDHPQSWRAAVTPSSPCHAPTRPQGLPPRLLGHGVIPHSRCHALARRHPSPGVTLWSPRCHAMVTPGDTKASRHGHSRRHQLLTPWSLPMTPSRHSMVTPGETKAPRQGHAPRARRHAHTPAPWSEVSRVTPEVSRPTPGESRVTPKVSRPTPGVSRPNAHVSHLTPYHSLPFFLQKFSRIFQIYKWGV